jgi:hypothetical protein
MGWVWGSGLGELDAALSNGVERKRAENKMADETVVDALEERKGSRSSCIDEYLKCA